MKNFYYMKLYELSYRKKIYYAIVCLEKLIPIIKNCSADSNIGKVIDDIYEIYYDVIKDEYNINELNDKCKVLNEWMIDNTYDEYYLENLLSEEVAFLEMSTNFCDFIIKEDEKKMIALSDLLVNEIDALAGISGFYEEELYESYKWQEEVLELVCNCKEYWPNKEIEDLKELFFKKYPLLIEGDVFKKNNNIKNYIIKEKEITLKKDFIDSVTYKNIYNINEFFKKEYDEIPKKLTMMIKTKLNDIDYEFTEYANIEVLYNKVNDFYFEILYEEDLLSKLEQMINNCINNVISLETSDIKIVENGNGLRIKNDTLTVTLLKEK